MKCWGNDQEHDYLFIYLFVILFLPDIELKERELQILCILALFGLHEANLSILAVNWDIWV